MPKKQEISQRYIERAYLSAGNVGALGGIASFARARKIKNLKALEESLNKIPTFTRHRPARTKSQRRPVIVKYPGYLVQADLVDIFKHRFQNKSFGYILIAIDVFSKFAAATPIKTKGSKHMLEGFKTLLKQFKFKIQSIQSDAGLEFFNREVKQYLASKGIHQYHSFSHLKAQTIERLIRTVKGKLWRHFSSTGSFYWLDTIPKIIKAYNSTPHSSHGFVPSLIKRKDYDNVLSNLYMKFALMKPKKPKYKLNDYVRISLKKLIFRKKYEANYSSEIFQVSKVHTVFPVVSYKLIDRSNRELDGSYIESEIISATPNDAA